MPTIASRGTNVVDMSGYEPVGDRPAPPSLPQPAKNLEPGYNVYLRCPLPPIWTTPPDSLRQYFINGVVPQVRLFNPPSNSGSNGSSVSNTYLSSSSGGSRGGNTYTTLKIVSTSLTTPSISPSAKYIGSLSLSKAFQLMNLTASSPCRVQIYGTAAEQSADSYRGIDVATPAGTAQNIICDVVLDTGPFNWTFQDRVGGNGDNPTASNVYITITNLDVITDSITVSLGYVPVVV